jgi:hypothetical protein
MPLKLKTMTDFSKTLIRCSSLSCLFTEPQSKEDKLAGRLSKTAQSHLVEVYAREIWGVEKDIVTKQMRKGTEAEEDGITLISIVDGKLYVKNDERKENEWICGHADIVEDDLLTDLKLSWDAFTFLPKLIEPVNKDYYYQLQGYLWLWGQDKGRLSYGLVNTPESIIQGELYRLLRSMNVISEESPKYKEAARKLISNMKFDHIPMEQRVIHQFIGRDEEIIAQIPEKVEKARKFLQELYEKHQNLVTLAL